MSKCIAIEGVEISHEELDALKEAAIAKREIIDGYGGAADALEEASNLPMDLGSGMGKGNKINSLGMGNATNQPTAADLAKEMN